MNPAVQIAEIDWKNCYSGSEFARLGEILFRLPGVKSVHFDRTRGIAHVGFDPSITNELKLESQLFNCGYKCKCHHRSVSTAQPGHPEVGKIKPQSPMATKATATRPNGRAASRLSAPLRPNRALTDVKARQCRCGADDEVKKSLRRIA